MLSLLAHAALAVAAIAFWMFRRIREKSNR